MEVLWKKRDLLFRIALKNTKGDIPTQFTKVQTKEKLGPCSDAQ